jgi:nucleoside-diphosphate-sugar epimerase
MRIHILGTRGFPSSYGGFETLVRHLAPELVQRGHEVTVFDREPVRRPAGFV